MPPVIFAAVAVGAAAAGYVAWGTALMIVVSTALGALNKPKAPGAIGATALSARSETVRSSITSRKIIYGECLVSGPMIYAGSSGEDNKYAHIIIPLAGHECEALGTVYFGDKPSHEYDTGYFRISKHLGASDQAADADLVAEMPEWTAAHRCRGCAYIYVRFEWDQKVWPSGLLPVKVVVKGRKVYDPRTTLTAWTSNWALCMRDYLRDVPLGLRCDADEIDEVEAAASASISAETVAIPGGGTQPRYSCNGVVDTEARPRDIIDSMKTAGAGDVVHSQGVYKIIAGAYRAYSMDIDESYLRGEVKIRLQLPKNAIFNTVRGLYISPSNFYELTDFPLVKSQTYITEDNGEEIVRDIELAFTDDATTAQRIALIELRKARMAVSMEWPGNHRVRNLSPQDTIRVSLASMGWVNKEFTIIDRTLADDGGVDLAMQETASSIWSWQGTDAVAVAAAPDTSLVSALVCPPPTGLNFEEDFKATDGAGLLSWTASPSAFVNEYRIRYRLVGAAEFTDFPGAVRETQATLRFLLPGDYQFQVQAINSLGTPSSWVQLTASITRSPVIERVSGLEIFGQGNNTEFTGRDVKLAWRESSLTDSYDFDQEPFGADSGARDVFFKDYEIRVFSATGVRLRTEQVTDNFYTYTYEKNAEDYLALHAGSPGAHRTLTFEVYQRGRQNQISEVPARITVTNPAPALPGDISLRSSFRTLFLSYTAPSDLDWTVVRVWLGTAPGFTPGPSNLVYEGPDTLVVIDALPDGTALDSGVTYYVALQASDGFGYEGTTSTTLSVTTVFIDGAYDVAEYSIGHAQIGLLEVWDANFKSAVIDKIDSGTISGKDFNVSTDGRIRSGQTAWNTGTGWWLGHSGGYPKFSIGSPSGNGLDWSAATGVMNYRGTLSIAAGSTGFSNFSDMPATLGAQASAGLYLSSAYLGFWSTSWKTYIKSDGTFYFSGQDANNYLAYNGSVLTFAGKLNVKSATSGARTEITEDYIKVYDSTGALRVKLGNLA